MKITTNLENWTGKEVTINVNRKKKSFTYNGHKVQLVLTESYKDGILNMDIYDIMVEGDKFGVATRDEGRSEAFEGRISEDNLSRLGSDIYSATVKMLSNVL